MHWDGVNSTVKVIYRGLLGTGRKDCHSWLGERAPKGFSEAFQAKIPSTQRLRGWKGRFVRYNKGMWGNSQRCFHSTPEIDGTVSTLKEFRDWWGDKDKQIEWLSWDGHDDPGTYEVGILKRMAVLSPKW